MTQQYSNIELACIEYNRQRIVLGITEQVKPRLMTMAAVYDASGLILITITHDFADPLSSYELVAQV